MRVLCVLAACCAVAAAPPPPPKAAPPEAPKPAYEPTSNYTVQTLEGWTVYVHNRLLGEKKDLGEPALKLLAALLDDVNRRLPKAAVERLRGVKFWVEADSKDVVGACYHPSRAWLEGHGFNPEKARSIEIGRPTNFLAWTDHQPAMIIHELAHAYHHQVLGYNQPDIKEAYRRAVESKSYESVLCYNGSKKRAYALNNDQEYFAELTEAYFSTNDFYPFVRAELKEHDSPMYALLKRLWENPPSAPAK